MGVGTAAGSRPRGPTTPPFSRPCLRTAPAFAGATHIRNGP